MRYRLAFAALLLPLAGCVVPPEPVGYGYGYPQPGYPGGYSEPGYPGAYPQPDYGYPGLAYNDDSPTLFLEGATVPLIFYGGSWGYWDHERHWHHAPEGVERHLDQRYPGGAGYHPWNGGPVGRPEGPRIGGFPFGNPGAGHSGGPPPPGSGFVGHPAAPPPSPVPGFVNQFRGAPPPAAPPPSPVPGFANQFRGTPPPAAAFHPQAQPPPPPHPAPAPGFTFNRGAPPPPPPHRPDDHH